MLRAKKAEKVLSLEASSTRAGWILVVGYFLSLRVVYGLPSGKEILFYPVWLLFFLIAFPRVFPIALRELDLVRPPRGLLKDLAFTCQILALNELIGILYFLLFVGNAESGVSAEPPVTVSLVLSGLVLAPVVEEAIFRGMLWRVLSRYGNLFALLTTSVLFLFLHGGGTPFLILLLGISAGLVMAKTNNLIYPVLIHMLHNSGLLLPSVTDGGKVEYLIPAAINLGLLAATFFLLKASSTWNEVKESLCDPALTKKLTQCFSTSGMLLYTLIFGGQMLLLMIAPT